MKAFIFGLASLIGYVILVALGGFSDGGYDYRKDFYHQHRSIGLVVVLGFLLVSLTSFLYGIFVHNSEPGFKMAGIVLSLLAFLGSLVLLFGVAIGG